MAQRTWLVKVDGTDHKIELEHRILEGSHRLLVDGWEVHKGRSILDLGQDIRFAVAGRWCVLRIAPSGLVYTYRLAMNELWTDDWTLLVQRPRLLVLGGYLLLAHAVGVLLLAPSGGPDTPSFVALVATRVILAVFLALQVFGGLRWGWYAALAYAAANIALSVASLFAGASDAWVPGDLGSPVGVGIGILTCGAAIAAMVSSPVRAFFAPARKAEPEAA